MKKYFSREVKIGIMVVVGLAALVFGFNYLRGVNIFVPTNSYYVKYEQLNGLEKSAPVMAKGYKVGLVREIIPNLNSNKPFVVVISLDNDLKIPQGSSLVLGGGLMGPETIIIEFDHSSNIYYKPGDTIPSSIMPGMLDAVTDSIIPKADKVLVQVDSTLLAVRAVLEKPALHNTLESLEVSAKNIETASNKFNTVVQKDVPVIVKDLGKTSANLAEVTESLNKADIGATLNTLDSAVEDLQAITDKINNGEGTIGLLINDEELYNNLTKTAENANELVVDLKEHPSRYVHFSIFGRKDKKK